MALLPAERAQVEAVLLRAQPELLPRVDALFIEYARFIALKVAIDPEPVTPCKAVDAVWHAHLICTRAYAALCGRANGGAMIVGRSAARAARSRRPPHTRRLLTAPPAAPQHHEPGIGSEESYAATLAAYERMFGEPPPRAVWGRAKVGAQGTA